MHSLVTARGHAVTAPKDTVEIGAIIEAGGEGRLFYGCLAGCQKLACAFETVSKQIEPERGAMLFLEGPAEMGPAHVTSRRHVIEPEVFGVALFEADERRGGSRRGGAVLDRPCVQVGAVTLLPEGWPGRACDPAPGPAGCESP